MSSWPRIAAHAQRTSRSGPGRGINHLGPVDPTGLALLEPLLSDPALERYQPLYAAHAELLSRERAELERRLPALR
jgi:hypothetical protein